MDKIAFFEVEDWEKEYITKALSGNNLSFLPGKLNKESLPQDRDLTIVSPFIYSRIDREVLNALPNLKLVATRSVGFDHIDIASVKGKGVTVSNVPQYGGDTVAEHTFALMLAISRKLIPSIDRTRRGNFSLHELTGFDLKGKTLGVIGAGNIGRKVIDMALCFGMKVVIYSRTIDEIYAKEKGVTFVDLDTLFSSSDIISLHIPNTPETKHIINMENISKFKKGSILINTARGPVVETQAILEGLERGILSGAGLDVLEEECSIKEERELLTGDFLKSCDIKTQLLNHVLLTREDVLVTPHNAFNSREALGEILDITIANIKAFLSGSPQNIVGN